MSAIIEATLNQSYKIEVTLVGNINYFNSVVPAHTHNVADITNISSFYASISHTHTVSQITDIASNYAPLNHTHPTLYEPKNTNIQNHISSTDNPHGVSKSQVGLSNVTNNAQVKKRASSAIGNIPTWDVTTGDSLGAGYGVDTTLTAGTDKIPTSSAVKTKTDSIDSNITTLTNSVNSAINDISGLDSRLDTAESEIDTLQTNVSTLTTNVSTNTTNISTLQSNVTALDGRLDTAESNITSLTTNVSTNTTNISTLQSDVTILDGRLDTAESNITTLTTNVSTNTTNINTLQSDVTALDGRLDTAESEIDTLQTNVSTLTTNVSTNTTNISTLQSDVTTLDGRLDTAESEIDTLQSQITTKQNTLVANDITTTLINTGAVTETKIADNAVTNSKLADNAVNTAEIADNAITTAKIANGNVTLAKLDSTGATSGQVPTYNGTNIAWATPSGGGGLDDGDYGDVTVSSAGTVMTIDNNAVTSAKMQQVGAYKTLANLTGATANLTEINWGSLPISTVILSGNVTYTKADFNGSNVLFLSATGDTRTLTISNTGFVAGDFICLLINQNQSFDINITIGGRSITNNRGNIIQAIYDGSTWNVWTGGGVFNTSSTIFSRTSFGYGAYNRQNGGTAFGFNAGTSQPNATALGNVAIAGGSDSCAIGANSTATGSDNTATGANSNADGFVTLANGRSANTNGFVRSNALGAFAYNRRYGATRIHLGTTTSTSDATNPSQNKEWATWNGTTANATITEIFLRGVSSNRCVLQARNNIKFRGQATAFRSDYSGTAGWDITGMIKRDGSNNTTLVGVTTTLTHSDGTGGTLVLTISADDTNESLRVQVTGNASETWTWLVELELLDLRIA